MSTEETYVESLGESGPMVVCLHGNAPPASLLPIAQGLSLDHRVLVLHRRGYGRSAQSPVLPVEQSLDELVSLLSRRVDRPFALLGHSFGAYLAFRVAQALPQVNKLLLLSPLLGMVSDEDSEAYRMGGQAIRRGDDLTDLLVERWLAPQNRGAEAVEMIRDWQSSAGFADDLEETSKVPLLGPAGPTVRTYLRVGALDEATPRAQAEAIAEMVPGAQLEVVHGVGHLLGHEDLEGTVAACRAVVDES